MGRWDKEITLECGIVGIYRKRKQVEYLDISLVDLYNGCGKLNNFKLLSELFNELHANEWENMGLHRSVGYYDSTDDIVLNLIRRNYENTK